MSFRCEIEKQVSCC
uniref:Uncharacterized protein n=1 Tax=Anguilla anguilla TaxID=7936 RepID=A0A0E9R830_ANGAN